ncbi:SLC13 family permease [Ammoniphilus sp. CFH 90114]|uniref:SLC13 family permease n=1 Tax=Ammoniphilus sp. CFH 90114 TaxID=2493665 RepID=UPI00100E233F|nr:SLC13 family permease [Ammoniphilus sp. CFH 90114]RXT06324.1 SLC13 family permease [Ammoniphilus sp. CFH 90114]
MTWEIALVILVVIIMLYFLIREISRPEFVIFCALAFLLLTGILSPTDALRGFSNEGMLTVAFLFIVAGAVQQSGLIGQIVMKSLGSGKNTRKALVRMMFPVSALSGFLNNTPIVVLFTPIIRKWCRDNNISPSKFLLPLSYATIFGGTITLIGTSTNLLVHGMMIEQGMKGFSMFQLGMVGIPACIAGLVYMGTIGYRLLPSRKTSEESFSESTREYLSEALVLKDSPIIGKTVEEAGLRHLEGLYLIEIIRNGHRIAPVQTDRTLWEGDRLIFTGLVSTIVDLQRIKGLKIETGIELKLDDLHNGNAFLVEAVVSHQSSIINQTVKESSFRGKYGAGVIAVHRNQERINSKVGDILFKPGDTLLLLAGKQFMKRWLNSGDFYLISPVPQPERTDPKKGTLSIIVLLIMVILATFEILSMFKAAVLAVITLFITKAITFEAAKKHIHFNVLIMIASAIGIGIAIDKTGTAAWIATSFIHITKSLGVVGMLACVYLITTFFTEIITNNAAAVLMFPISQAIALQTGADPTAFFVTITIAASASFATPIGYQTNLIVYGPGGYRFSDYLKVGIPLNLLYMFITVTTVAFLWL